jgi:hypothetical protein
LLWHDDLRRLNQGAALGASAEIAVHSLCIIPQYRQLDPIRSRLWHTNQ